METIFKFTEIFTVSYDLSKSRQIKKVVEIATNKNNLKCFEFEIEFKNHFKNGKQKGKSWIENKKHFFEIVPYNRTSYFDLNDCNKTSYFDLETLNIFLAKYKNILI
jgi:hypothetical protein